MTVKDFTVPSLPNLVEKFAPAGSVTGVAMV